MKHPRDAHRTGGSNCTPTVSVPVSMKAPSLSCDNGQSIAGWRVDRWRGQKLQDQAGLLLVGKGGSCWCGLPKNVFWLFLRQRNALYPLGQSFG